jgi:hypothetical protein
MNTKRIGTIMIALCFELLAVVPSWAFYNPSTGRWLRRDPAGEEGGENLYLFAGNQPISFIDPTGLEWKIRRYWGDRALATSECGDTLADLAKRVGLDENEYALWLRAEDGGSMTLSPTQPLEGGRVFSIPNRVLFVTGGSLNWLSYDLLLLRVPALAEAAREYGYSVHYMDYQVQPYTKAEILAQRANLHGMMFFGHGSVDLPIIDPQIPGRFIYDMAAGNTEEISASEMLSGYHYGIVVAKFCSSGIGGWSNDASKNGTAFVTHGPVTLPVIFQFRIWWMRHVLGRESGR